MATLEDTRRKIETASDLGSVVATMKTLAAVSIRQYERAVEALTDYSRTIELGFHILLRDQPAIFESGVERGRTGAVIFGTDQGMCGQFNESIVSFVRSRQREVETDRWLLLAVGARAEGQLADAGLPVDQTHQVPTSASDITNLVHEVLPQIERWKTERNVTRLLVFHNRRTSASSYAPRQLQLMPIDPRRFDRWREAHWRSNSLPTFASDRRRLLSRLVRQYLFVSLFRACAESLASENASRISAMQSAEKNIADRLDELRDAFHHIRQTAITEELLDVVTGFEALSKPSSRKGRR